MAKITMHAQLKSRDVSGIQEPDVLPPENISEVI